MGMIYEVRFSLTVNEDLIKLAKSEPKAYQKALRFIEELREHPKTGTGHPEPLKGKPEGRWSREITKKHRLVYRIFENEVVVEKPNKNMTATTSAADEIKKFKELLDCGIITQEEFDAKKKQLLGV